jgi:hypothetical protein
MREIMRETNNGLDDPHQTSTLLVVITQRSSDPKMNYQLGW